MSVPCRGIGVVARNGLHELVLFLAFSRILDTSAGVRAIKDADSINGSLAVLHVLGSRHSSVGDARVERVATRWSAVSKEHNNLLGARATRSDALSQSQLQTIVGARGAGGLNVLNGALENGHITARAIGQALHYLCVIVAVPSIRIVADIVGLLARKLNNGNPMLPIDTLDTLVLLGDGIDKAVGSALERIDTLGTISATISATHRIIHRARGVQHHHDVEWRGNRYG